MRPPTACVACRNRRRKCEVDVAGEACKFCKHRHVSCSFTNTSSTSTIWSGPSPASPSTATPEDLELSKWQSFSGIGLPPQPICVDLLDLYFKYIHDTFHSIFHRPSLTEDVLNGSVPRVILLSIISLSARFSQDPYFAQIDARVRGQPYAREAERLLDIRDVSLSTIQACVLLGAFLITEGEPAAEALYYGLGCRMAMLLDLPNMRVATRLEREINIRVWWTLSMIDVWSSNGVRVPRALTPKDGIPYPIEETVFLEMRRELSDLPSPTSLQESASSLLAQMVKLNAILVEISQVNAAAASSGVYSFEFGATVDILGKKLDNWYDNLPTRLRNTPENIRYYANLGLGGVFVAVYLGYYHYGQLLYYQYLHESSYEATPGTHAAFYADRCKKYATSLCEILYTCYGTPGAEVYYTMVGHVLVIASTVQLHILLFSSDDAECRGARYRLERNFEILTRLQIFWPTLDVCFARFREFHKACEKSQESSFRMDRWMLQFLFEFAKPIREKGEDDEDELTELKPWSMQDLGFSPFSGIQSFDIENHYTSPSESSMWQP